MKRGKMIKMVATGTGAREVVIGWLLCLGAWGFLRQALLQTSMLQEKPEPHRLTSCPCWSRYVGLLVVWGCSRCRQEGSLVPWGWVLPAELPGSEGDLCPLPLPSTHTHPSDPLQMPTSVWEWAGRNTWPGELRAVALVGGGCLPEGMAHCSCQIKPEPQDKQIQCKQLEGQKFQIVCMIFF